MIGVPIDLVPEFPTNAPAILLTAASSYDKDLVVKVKKFVQGGGRVIATTGLIEVLGDRGFQDIVELQVAGRRVMATRFSTGRGFGTTATAEPDVNILLPQIRRCENDNRLLINFSTALGGYPMAISSTYGQGTFCVLAIPDDFADLYRLPQSVLNQIRALLGRGLFVSLDGPDHVSLFAYDNRTFIVQNLHPKPVTTRVSVVGAKQLRDLLTDQVVASAQSAASEGRGFVGGRGNSGGNSGPMFELNVAAHSFRVFQAE